VDFYFGINATVERATSGEVERPQLMLSDHESLPDDALQIVRQREKEDGPREAAAPWGGAKQTIPLRSEPTYATRRFKIQGS
jgi:hypothetical protein